jgi:heat shock protein HtpX
MNQLKTAVLLAALTALIIAIGRVLGGYNGMIIAFLFAIVMNVGSYWFSDRIVLSMTHAQELTPQDAPQLYSMVQRLAANAGLPMPRLYVVPDEAPNAFATGRDPNHAAVAVTQGLMRILDQEEVEGVIAHELAHVKNRDTLISTVAATLAGAITGIAQMLQFQMFFGGYGRDDEDRGGNPLAMIAVVILAPIAAALIQFAISRSREYIADATGARISGRPLDLANALLKLERGAHSVPMHVNPATAHMYIVNPLSGGSLQTLFSTHPSTADRVARLEALAREMGTAPSYR